MYSKRSNLPWFLLAAGQGIASQPFRISFIVLGTGVAAIALVVIAGWITHAPKLIQVDTSFAPMQFNTALCFLVTGLGFVLFGLGRTRLAVFGAILVAAFALVTGLQYVLGRDFRIDTLFIDPFITAKTSHPGRMAPNTIVTFLVAGVAVSVASMERFGRRRWSLVAVLGALISGIAIVVIVGYVTGVEAAVQWANLTAMAAFTAVAFLLCGSALVVLAWSQDKPRETHLPRWCAVAVAIGLASVTLGTWQALASLEERTVRRAVEAEADHLVASVQEVFVPRIQALERIAKRWEIDGGTQREVFEADVLQYLADQPDLQAINWIAPSYRIQWVVPERGNEAALGLDIRTTPSAASVQWSRESRKTIVSGAIELAQDGLGVIVFAPLFPDHVFDGFLEAVYRYRVLFAQLGREVRDLGFGFALADGGREIYRNSPRDVAGEASASSLRTVSLYNVTWDLTVWPEPAAIAELTSPVAEIVLVLGLLSTVLASGAMHFARGSVVAQNRTDRANRELQHEIEARTRLAAEADQLRQRLQLIFESVGEGIYGLDRAGCTTFANPAACRMVGWAEQEMVDSPQHDLIHHSHPDGSPYPKEECPIYAAFTDGEVHQVTDEIFWRKDGSSFPVEYASTPMRNEDGGLEGAVVVFRDVTERKRQQETIHRANTELKATNEELEAFCYSVSHDLRAPLRTIDGFSHALTEDYADVLDESAQDYLARIRNAATRMGTLIDDLLALSRLTRHEMRREHVDLSAVAAEVVEELQSGQPDRKVETAIHEGYSVTGDPVLLRAVLDNLIGNAWKFTSQRDDARVEFGATTSDDGSTTYFIRDNGTGFDMDYADKLFAPFQRLHGRDEFEGTGVGLATAQRAINRHGGRIWCEAARGEGATFYFTL